MSFLKIIFFISLLFVSNSLLLAQNISDSITLQDVVVIDNYLDAEIRSTAPLQILSKEKLEKLNALQISDAVKFFSGVTIKDYGGIGGLKTISVRSLGANHTAVSYDGIRVNDCQTGQIDIGRFSLDNVDVISLSSGQSDDIFQPAQMFAAGAALNIKTQHPLFKKDRNTNGKITLKGGSFGLINPSVRISQKIGNRFAVSASGEFLTAHGRYPYTLDYGFSGIDSTSREMRKNTDVKNMRFEGALFGNFSENESLETSFYYYQSERGLPGATIFYNTENFSSQRLWDRTFFTRAHYRKKLSPLWTIQANAKYNLGTLRYLDPTYLNEIGKDESNYLQQEWYGSASVLFRAFNNISLSASNDVSFTNLDADSYQFSYPTRLTWLSVLAAKYADNYFLATANLLSTVVNEKVKTGVSAKNYHQISPYASISIKPFTEKDLRFRFFYKNIFRMPTFNDLYYSRIGNPKLVPEKTNQLNAGLTYSTKVANWFPSFTIIIDAYHND
ncbi:MAG TPA: TonB-dependent receptor plug domain-containing protein, partial [Salinivirgaceae bacterium]|nr:TonB-dependent receptor plug domain-containing protein [Salinivirgaceae bacterium]